MASPRRKLKWRCGSNELDVGERTLVMGILNVTPDSFSDGGRYLDSELAIQHALEMAEQGIDIVDVGGESTRPGADPVSTRDEIARVIPVIEALQVRVSCAISVDTMKAEVASQALDAGATIVNDVSALTADPEMLKVVARSQAGVVLMHMLGSPRTMQADPTYGDVVQDIHDYLAERIAACVDSGIVRERIVIDPGIGFGKTVEHNLQLLAGIPSLTDLGRPILIGLSRKSFIGKVTGCEVGDRLAGTLAATAYALTRGADIIRVHDAKDSCDLVRIIDMLRAEETHDVTTDSDTMAGCKRTS